MNLPKREIKDIIPHKEAVNKVEEGARKIYEAVATTYGPSGHNVILGMPFGDPLLTRDGVTVAKRTILPDKAEDDAAAVLRQASEKTNRTAGDGTTATIVLGYHLFKNALDTRQHGMHLKKQIEADSRTVIDFLKKEAEPAGDHLLDVATVSAGDSEIGQLIAHTLEEIGDGGGITIREQNYPTTDVEKVNGYYFDKGFFALNQPVEFAKPLVFVTQKPLTSNSDIIPLLSRVITGENKNLVIVGDVRMNSDAMNTLLLNVMQQKLQAVVIPPPAFGDEGLHFLEDIALYVGSKLFLNGDDIQAVKQSDEYFGAAERVQATQEKAIIFKGGGDGQAIVDRAATIKGQADKEKSSHRKDQLEQRYAKLTGKIAIVNVGGSTPTEMEELRYRVEDAIEATKSAMADGVLPGGATMLVRAAELDISEVFKKSLLDSFRKLMNNAGENAEKRLGQVQDTEKNFGFNLRDMTDKPIDLTKAGVFDAARSIIQTVENAASAAGSLLTVGAFVEPIERPENDVDS